MEGYAISQVKSSKFSKKNGLTFCMAKKKRLTFEYTNKQKESAMNYNLIATKLRGKISRCPLAF